MRKIVVATPFYQYKGWSPYIRSLLTTFRMFWEAKIDVQYWETSGDAYVDRARNCFAWKFMQSGADFLWFIDSDMSWTPEAAINLVKRDVDIVGAGYPCKNNWDYYGCEPLDRVAGWVPREDGLLPAAMIPGGFMKIRKGTFEKIMEHEPGRMYYEKQEDCEMYDFFGRIVPYGEDYSFCLRAQAAGVKIFIEPDCSIQHWGVEKWEGNFKTKLSKGEAWQKCA